MVFKQRAQAAGGTRVRASGMPQALRSQGGGVQHGGFQVKLQVTAQCVFARLCAALTEVSAETPPTRMREVSTCLCLPSKE